MKKLTIIILLFSCALATHSTAQEEDNMWRNLADVTYIKKYDEFLGFKVDFPVFSEDVEALAGQEITIRGYIIPIEGYKSHKEFIFSAYPYNMCFFCGGAGPETVMEIEASQAIPYTAKPITIRGILNLNDEDINRLMYNMTNVVKVDE